MTESKLRLFVAFDVPEWHRAWLQDAVAPMHESLPDARWVPVGSQHVTLKFLGWVQDDALPGIVEACSAASQRSWVGDIRIGGFGGFPNTKRARVLWAGLVDSDDFLQSVAKRLDEGLEPLGFEREHRPYTPHLTLARFKVPTRIEEELPAVDASDAPPFLLRDIILFRSHMSPTGSRYEELERFPLEESPGSIETSV